VKLRQLEILLFFKAAKNPWKNKRDIARSREFLGGFCAELSSTIKEKSPKLMDHGSLRTNHLEPAENHRLGKQPAIASPKVYCF
jgi:hypothetical protein